MDMYLNEKIGLTERERKFAVDVISSGVKALISARRFEKSAETEPEAYEGNNHRRLAYSYAERNTAREIAGGSLSALFGGMGMDTIIALENLSMREGIHTYFPIIVEEYYEELLKQWNGGTQND